MQKIPFHIISGFLGSGKTTLLKRILEQNHENYRIGIIQNEYAPANIDGAELKRTGNDFEILEINNGSVFCVCLLGDFIRSLGIFIDKYQPDILIIEASGLSDTTSIAEVISASSLSEKIVLASNWCVVDALNYQKTGLMKQRVTHQLRMADIVVINKTDLAPDQISIIREDIRKINPFAEILESAYCEIMTNLGSAPVRKFYFTSAEPLARPEVNAMVLKTTRKISRYFLEEFLRIWIPKAYRIKGFVNLKEGNTVAVQCTFGQQEILDVADFFAPTELIAISDQFVLREWNASYRDYCRS